MLYKERPPVIGACYYERGENDVRDFIADASSILGNVSEVLVRCDSHFGEVKGVRFYYSESEIEELLVEPGVVLCKEKKLDGKVWLMGLDEFENKYEAVATLMRIED